MKRKIVAVLLLMAVALNTGCGSQKPEMGEEAANQPSVSEQADEQEQEADEGSKAENPMPKIKTPVVTFEKIERTVMSEDGQVTLLYGSYMKPTFYLKDAEIKKKLEGAFEEIEAEYNQVCSEREEEAKEEYAEMAEELPPYEEDYDFYLQRNDDRVLSLVQGNYSYMRGVHGYTARTGLNFDLKTGEKLSLDIISDDKEALLASAKTYISEILEIPRFANELYGSKEDALQILEEDILPDDSLWYFTNSGITFVANAYILGPYAAGAFYFNVPYGNLEGLKEEYIYQGPLEMSISIGASGTADLNGDGQEDTISYQCHLDDATSESVPMLTINEKDFSDALRSDELYLSEGADEYMADYYYIVDLDVSDSYLELAILDQGPSDDPVTFFFRYDGQELTYLGNIADLVGKHTTILNGNGTIQADIHSGEPGTEAETVLYQVDEETGIQRYF